MNDKGFNKILIGSSLPFYDLECSQVGKNMVSKHKILGMDFRIKVSHATSIRVLFITMSSDTSMRKRIWDGIS